MLTAAVPEARPPVGRQKTSVVSSRTGLAQVAVPVSLRQVRATERWRRCGPVHGHCSRRGCGGGPRRKSCREHAGFPSDGEQESRQVLREMAGRSYSVSDFRSCPDDLSLSKFLTYAYGMLAVARAVRRTRPRFCRVRRPDNCECRPCVFSTVSLLPTSVPVKRFRRVSSCP